MNPTIEAVMEANKNLNKKREKLVEENKELFWFKEKFMDMSKRYSAMEQQLLIKRDIVRVEGVYPNENIHYVLQITKAIDTPDGMFIEVLLDKPNSETNLDKRSK